MSERVFLARFDSADALLSAARAARAAGFELHEAWTPVPIPELDPLLDARPSRLRWFALAAAVVGSGGAFALQRYAALVSWPMAGPAPSALVHLPVALAVGGIAAAVGASVGFFAGFMRRGTGTLPALDDCFALALSLRGSRFDSDEAAVLLGSHGATATGHAEVPR